MKKAYNKIAKWVQKNRVLRETVTELSHTKDELNKVEEAYEKGTNAVRKGAIIDYDEIYLKKELIISLKERVHVLTFRSEYIKTLWETE